MAAEPRIISRFVAITPRFGCRVTKNWFTRLALPSVMRIKSRTPGTVGFTHRPPPSPSDRYE